MAKDDGTKKLADGKGALDAAAGLVEANKLKELGTQPGAVPGTQPGAQPAAQPGVAAPAAQPAAQPGAQPAAQPAAQPGAAPGAAAPGAQPAAPGAQPGAAAPGAQPGAAPVAEPVVVETAFGTKVFGGGDPAQGAQTLNSFEDVQNFAKAFSIDINEVNDFQTLLKEHDALKRQVVESGQYKVQLDTYERTLKGLPTEVATILEAATTGQDYTKVIQSISQRGVFNFEKNFDGYNERELINHYAEERHTKEELDDMDEGQYKALRSMAKTRYETDQLTYTNTVLEQQRNTALAQKQFDVSVETSLAQLKANNPDMDVAKIQRIRSVMTAELHSTLFNQDNTYKADAAEKIAMQEYGKDTILAHEHTIGDLVTKYTAVGASQATERILQTSDSRLMPGAPEAPSQNVITEVAKKETSFLHTV